jgi:predicted  nucleic acid-binding Zn-ribbon protein
MTKTVDALRTLHRIHRQMADLKDRLERGPRQVRAGHQAVERTEHELTTAKETYKRTRMESDGQQLQLKQREAKIDDLQRKLNECNSNAEFKILKDQIAAEKQANAVLEDEILDKLERLDELQHKTHEAEQRLVKTREELQKTQQRVEGEHGKLQSELERVKAELQQTEASLPTDFKADYDRIVRARGEEAMAPVDGETCGGCNTILTPQVMNELYLSKMVFCKACGCLLYLPEDRSVRGGEG